MSATACQLCGKPLSRIRLLREGDFCCREHREEYRLRRGINRVLEASAVSQLERQKERPQLLPVSRPAADAGTGAPRSWPDAPSLGRAACEFFVPVLRVAAALRPPTAGHVHAAGHGAGPEMLVERRTDFRPVRIRGRVALRNWAPAGRPIAGRAVFAPARWRPPLSLGAEAQPRRRPGFGQPLCRPGEARVRAVRLAPRSGGRHRLVPRPLASGSLSPFYSPDPAFPRSAPVVGFRSGDPRNITPIPAARRRPGRPVRTPAGELHSLHPAAVPSDSARRRVVEERFDAALPPPLRPSSWERLSIRAGVVAAMAHPVVRLDGIGAQAESGKRLPGAPPLLGGDVESSPLTVPPFDVLPDGGSAGLRHAERLPQSPAAGGHESRRRPAGERFPERAARPPAAHAAFAAPGLHPSAAVPLPPASMPAIVAGAARVALDPFRNQAPMCPAVRLALLGAVGGTLCEAGGAAMPTIEDNFGSGLGRWVGGVDDWRLDAAGARTGSLALFTPSLGMRDYDLEFLAKIERRSIGWVFRAADLDNYYLVRIARGEQGRANAFELTRRAVVGGVAEDPVTVALPVTVRSKAAFRVLTSVTGADFTVAVEGQVVDGWSDSRLPAGGIGFQAEQDDGARLYWVKLSPRGRQPQAAPPLTIAPRQAQGRDLE